MPKPPRVNTIQQEAFLGEVKAKKDSQWMVELLLNGSPVSFKVDTGADVTVVPEKTFKSIKGSELRPAETALYGPNRQRIPSLGQATMVLQKGDKEIKEEVFVVPQADQALLGKPAIEALGLLQRIDVVNEEDDVTVIKQRYPKLFQGLGKLAGKYKRHRKRGQHSKPPSTCTRCGRSPLHNKSECPAKDEQCHQCGKRGHIQSSSRV